MYMYVCICIYICTYPYISSSSLELPVGRGGGYHWRREKADSIATAKAACAASTKGGCGETAKKHLIKDAALSSPETAGPTVESQTARA